jgi:serine/threonine protein kinase
MAVKIETNAEPIPGYRLVERLGSGGFGEVWKAVAPGGLHKAIKFVHGDIEGSEEIDGADEEGARAKQELKALKRVQEVRHPYILSLERYDIIQGQLMIVMELADRTLWDRFKECRAEGLQGIPRKELLGYLRETAEALDLMNAQYQLQHLDIKPQNLFLVHNHVKVADFGLIKDLQGTVASVTGGVTPVYAAPETFDGEVRRSTDQYSLAIVYQELLTGQRPFAGTTARQLVLQHLQAEPDLSSLPPADRPVVQQALSKHYGDRFESCEKFIQALLGVSPGAGPGVAVNVATPLPNITSTRKLPGAAANGEVLLAGTSAPVSKTRDLDLPPDSPAPAADDGSSRVIPRPGPSVKEGPPSLRTAESSLSRVLGAAPQTSDPITVQNRRHQRSASEIRLNGVLKPALVIGLGHCGQTILRQLRFQLQESFGGFRPMPHIRFLYIDTDASALHNATQGGDDALRHSETLATRLHRPSHYLKARDYQKRFASWLPAKTLYRIPRQLATQGSRALGRLALLDHFARVNRRLIHEIEACLDTEALNQSAADTGLGVGSRRPRVYLVTSLAGGTGSGMMLDLAFLVRRILRKRGFEHPDVVGVCLVSTSARTPEQKAGLANGYAALTELHHYSKPGAQYTAFLGDDLTKSGVFSESGPAFRRCLLLASDASEIATVDPDLAPWEVPPTPQAVEAARLLYVELCTPLGRTADRRRRESDTGTRSGNLAPVLATAGMYSIRWPRKQLLRRTARQLCGQLVQRWMSKNAQPLREAVKHWAAQHWGQLGLSSDEMILRLQGSCEKRLRERPESLLQKALDQVASAAPATSRLESAGARGIAVRERVNMGAIVGALAQIDQLLGVPEDCHPLSGPKSSEKPLGALADHLREATLQLGNETEVWIAELIVRLIEEPDFRLAGAEEAIRQFSALVHQAIHHQEELSRELKERSVSLYQRLGTLLEQADRAPPTPQSGWKLTFAKRTPAKQSSGLDDLQDVLRLYSKCRYQAMLLEQVGDFYVSLRGLLTDQLREVDFCRERLRELAAKFAEVTANGQAHRRVQAPQPQGRVLLPETCRTLDEAVSQSVARCTPEDVVELDRNVQQVLKAQFRALVHICMAPASLLREVAPAVQAEAEAFLDTRLEGADVIEMYLAATAGESEEAASDSLVDAFEEARSDLTLSSPTEEVCLVALPPSPHQEKFRNLVRDALRIEAPVADSADEILLYRERWFASPWEIKQLAREAREIYEQCRKLEHLTPHCRMDIAEWQPPRN